MALMMVLMVAFLMAVPGGHMGLLDSHHSPEHIPVALQTQECGGYCARPE